MGLRPIPTTWIYLGTTRGHAFVKLMISLGNLHDPSPLEGLFKGYLYFAGGPIFQEGQKTSSKPAKVQYVRISTHLESLKSG